MDVDGTTVIVAALGLAGTLSGSIVAARAARETAEEETKRLREEHREAERQNRQGTYHRLLANLDRFDSLATGYGLPDTTFDELLAEFDFLHGGILLFGDDEVTEAIGPLVDLFFEVGANLDPNDKQGSFSRAYGSRRKEIIDATGTLVFAMRRDVRDVAEG